MLMLYVNFIRLRAIFSSVTVNPPILEIRKNNPLFQRTTLESILQYLIHSGSPPIIFHEDITTEVGTVLHLQYGNDSANFRVKNE
jgi:hypothetical protein